MSATTDWLRLKLVRDDLDSFDGGPEQERWVILLGTEVTLLNGEKRLDGITVGTGPTKLAAKHDAAHRLREMARRIDWGTL